MYVRDYRAENLFFFSSTFVKKSVRVELSEDWNTDQTCIWKASKKWIRVETHTSQRRRGGWSSPILVPQGENLWVTDDWKAGSYFTKHRVYH